jgi:hypothetical protein
MSAFGTAEPGFANLMLGNIIMPLVTAAHRARLEKRISIARWRR